MSPAAHIHRAGWRALAVITTAAVTGCAHFRDDASSAEPPAEPPAVAVPDAALPPSVAPARPVVPPISPPPTEALLLFEGGTADHASVAQAIAAELPAPRYRVRLLDLDDAAATERAAERKPTGGAVSIAIGLNAARFARANLRAQPLVFCQIFNYAELLDGAGVWGVESMPPLALQFSSWKALDASLHRVALIVGGAQQALVEQATRAAERAGIELLHVVSSSDRETLYLFKRLAPQVDGLWLFPDNRILSPNVIQELLGYALSHEVGALVFNDALLPWGALLSVSNTPASIARAVRGVTDRVVAGSTQGLAAVSPLTELEVTVNEGAASRLGVTFVPVSPWVVRAPQ
jgi:ABC-type uncharacterized transport system substrate-binding protein